LYQRLQTGRLERVAVPATGEMAGGERVLAHSSWSIRRLAPPGPCSFGNGCGIECVALAGVRFALS
jgi:hypothetical protein